MPRGILKFLIAIIVVIASANLVSFSGAAAGTIGYYRFESGPTGPNGMTIVDSSGNNNNGIAGSSPSYNSNVPFAQVPQTGQADTLSMLFNAPDAAFFDYEFPFQILTDATLELWINPVSFGDNDFLWTTTGSGDQNRFNFRAPNANVCLDYREPNGTLHDFGCTAPGGVPHNQWTYVAFVKQGNVYSTYLNNAGTGNVTNLANQATDSAPNLPTSTQWTINGRLYEEPTSCCQFAGLLDEVRLSDAALSPDAFLVTPELSVTINVKPPAQAPVTINLKAPMLPVAILSSSTFNATTQVDPATIKLSGASVSTSGSGKFSCSTKDVNGDGLPDLVCQVNANQLQLPPNATMVTLNAKTFTGRMMTGGEAIRIVGP